MIALLLSLAITGEAWAFEAVQQIGGRAHAILIDSVAFGGWGVQGISTIEQLDAGIVDQAEATRRNIAELWPDPWAE